MLREAAAVGRFHSEATERSYARMQILTVEELFRGRRPDIPLVDHAAAFRTAPRERVGGEQAVFFRGGGCELEMDSAHDCVCPWQYAAAN